jgi:hypothetical protein
MRVFFETEPARTLVLARIRDFHLEASAALTGIDGSTLAAGDTARLERHLTKAVRRVASDLRVEILPKAPGELDVIVAPNVELGRECIALEIVRRAPTIPGVAFLRHGSAMPIEQALADVHARTGLDLSAARVRVGFSRGHLLEVVVHSPHVTSVTDELALSAADLLVSRSIGGRHFHEWIGAVDVAPIARGGPLRVIDATRGAPQATLPVGDLPLAVNRAIEEVEAALPDLQHQARVAREAWTLLELTPEPQDDYSHLDDLALVSTVMPEALKSFLQGSPFASRRFSRTGERLVYVKLDATRCTSEGRHALRVAAEDAVESALSAHGAGAVVGAGLGLRYAYLFVALEDLDRARALLAGPLRALGVDRRAWILCCDIGWEEEWLGVWDDTPPPP